MAEYVSIDWWANVLKTDYLEVRRKAVAALDDPQCLVPPDETRPDLYRPCAADSLVQIADLQSNCAYFLKVEPESVFDDDAKRKGWASSQAEYAEFEEREHWGNAIALWKHGVCRRRSADLAARWIDAIPPPPDPLRKEGKWRTRRPPSLPHTQELDLKEVARRLGYPLSSYDLGRLKLHRQWGHSSLDGNDPAAVFLANLPPPDDPMWQGNSRGWKLAAVAERLRENQGR